jgi:asparagine synthase (glutamine-hydrolysing)
VPLGVFLSGGVDSALVAALAAQQAGEPLATFSVGFADPAYDERPKARRVAHALRARHCEIACDPHDVPVLLPEVTASADHLLADQSLVPLAKLAREARRSVKVVLTGDGGDELLAGYATYRALDLARRWVRWVPEGARGALAELAARLPGSPAKMAPLALLQRFLASTGGDLARAHASWRSIWSHAEISRLLRGRGDEVHEWGTYAGRMQGRPAWSLLQRAVHADVTTWLTDSILAKLDRATMATGLEARSPLLDSELVVHCFATLLRDPANLGKGPIRRLLARRLGDEVARTPKEGFQTPFAAWFAGPLRAYVSRSLEGLLDALPGVFDEQLLRGVAAEHALRRRNHDLKIWSLVALSEWARLYPKLRLED